MVDLKDNIALGEEGRGEVGDSGCLEDDQDYTRT